MMTPLEQNFVHEAAAYFEQPSWFIAVSNAVGRPFERGLKSLPAGARKIISTATHASLQGALKTAISSLGHRVEPALPFAEAQALGPRQRFGHQVAACALGAAGGWLGLGSLLLELPVSTTVLLRMIAGTAARFGEDLTSPETQLGCLFVFSSPANSRAIELGSKVLGHAAATSYFEARVSFASLVKEGASYVAQRGATEASQSLGKHGASAFGHLIARVASQFEIVVGDKFLAQLLPFVGAATGAAVNVAFVEHFASVARYHFGLRSLERAYGQELVAQVYRNAHLPGTPSSLAASKESI